MGLTQGAVVDAVDLASLLDAHDGVDGVLLLGICRGFQELNVALGGTLDAAVHARTGRMDHREGPHDRPIGDWYEDRHPVDLMPGGLLARWADGPQAMVNSLHHQGVDRLAPGLRVEATAPDGLVEAVTVPAARAFALAVQWHPEMRVHDNALARRIFEAFGDACRVRQRERFARRVGTAGPVARTVAAPTAHPGAS